MEEFIQDVTTFLLLEGKLFDEDKSDDVAHSLQNIIEHMERNGDDEER